MKEEDTTDYLACLKDAAEAIKEAMSLLDLGSRRCPKCGSVRFNTFSDKQSSNALGAALTRLESILVQQ